MSISSASEPESSLITFTGSESSCESSYVTQDVKMSKLEREGIKERENGERGEEGERLFERGD